jgi:hypothetical protein
MSFPVAPHFLFPGNDLLRWEILVPGRALAQPSFSCPFGIETEGFGS